MSMQFKYLISILVICILGISIIPIPVKSNGGLPTSLRLYARIIETFDYKWAVMSNEDKEKIHNESLWIARVLLSEDTRRKPWIMMASIVKNRVDTEHRRKTNVWSVIHDKRQFSAVTGESWNRYKKLTLDSNNSHFNESYDIARNVLVMGVPNRYEGITHAYYPSTMTGVYGYNKSYPTWDTPNNPMDMRDGVDGWVYGAP